MADRLLEGRVAVVTGSGAGIGLAIARHFAAHGAAVVLSGRGEARGRAAEGALRDTGAKALYVKSDVSHEDDVRGLMGRVLSEYGAIDILVNNAGPNGDDVGFGVLHEVTTEALDRTLKVGAYGPFWCCKYAVPAMLAGNGGSIVNVSSIAAIRALPHAGGYAMAKSVLEALSRQIANDYASAGIRSNSLLVGTVRPGPADVSTLPAGFDPAGVDAAIGRTTMMATTGQYADVADAALFLASSLSQYITGASIPVDGGALSKIQYPDYLSN